MQRYPTKKHYNNAPSFGSGAGGAAGAGSSIQYNNSGNLDGFGEYNTTVYKKLIHDGSFRSLSENSVNENNFSDRGALREGFGFGVAHDCEAVNTGPDNSIFHVMATCVVVEDGGSTGGSIVIAGTFKKNAGVITQIGATQTPYAVQEDLAAGTLAAAFSISGGNNLRAVLTTTNNCYTIVDFHVVSRTNAA
jgi:hypothetical protein